MAVIRMGPLELKDSKIQEMRWCEKTAKILVTTTKGKRKKASFETPSAAKDTFYAAARQLDGTHDLTERHVSRNENMKSPMMLGFAGVILLVLSLVLYFAVPCELTKLIVETGTSLSLAGGIWVLAVLWAVVRFAMPQKLHILTKKTEQ